VLRAGISETGNEADWWFFHWNHAAVILSGVKRSEKQSNNPDKLHKGNSAGSLECAAFGSG